MSEKDGTSSDNVTDFNDYRLRRALSGNDIKNVDYNEFMDRTFRGGIDTSGMSDLDKAYLDAGIDTGMPPDELARKIRQSAMEAQPSAENTPNADSTKEKTALRNNIIVTVIAALAITACIAVEANTTNNAKATNGAESSPRPVQVTPESQNNYPTHVKVERNGTIWGSPDTDKISELTGKTKGQVIIDIEKVNGISDAGLIQPGFYDAPMYDSKGNLILLPDDTDAELANTPQSFADVMDARDGKLDGIIETYNND